MAILILTMSFHANLLGLEADRPHEEHRHHAGFLIGAVYNLAEEKYMLGLGLEYEHVLPIWDGLAGIGLAGEVVFDEHKHYALSVLFPIHPFRELTLFVAPGVLFIEKQEMERRFSIHFGLEYEFELEKIFLAPEFEIAFAGDDIHLMLGIHIGFGF